MNSATFGFTKTHTTFLSLAVLVGLVMLVPAGAEAGTQNLAKISLHGVGSVPPAKSCGLAAPSTPCIDYTTTRPTSDFSTVYLVVTNGFSGPGIAGLSCGLDYAGDSLNETGIGILSWTRCADLDFPVDGPNGPWPASNSGNRITWEPSLNCQRTEYGADGVHAVAGAFYIYSYSADVLSITKNDAILSDPELLVADCGAVESVVPLARAGAIGFGTAGFNPCSVVGKDPKIDYITDPIARPIGVHTFSAVGTDIGLFGLDATLQGVSDVILADTVIHVSDDEVLIEADLSSAVDPIYDLIITNNAGDDTLEDALVIYQEAVDLARITVSPAGDAERFPTLPPSPITPSDSVAFVSGRDAVGGNGIFIKTVDALDIPANVRKLVESEESINYPDYNADGTSIVFELLQSLFVADTGTGGIAIQATGGDPVLRPEYSPVDDRIAYTRVVGIDQLAIHTIWEGTDDITQLTFPAAPVEQAGATWSPDGARILYVESDGINPGTALKSVSSTLGEAAGVTEVLPRDGSMFINPSWSPDGKWVAYASDQNGGYDIYVAPADGPSFDPIQITDHAANDIEPHWTPDGMSIVFVSNRGGVTNLYQATNLPIFVDSDGDGVPDASDPCHDPVDPGEMDFDFDGCPDQTASFRMVRFWAPKQFPYTFETDAVGDPTISDDSEFDALTDGINAWNSLPNNIMSGVDDMTRGGPSIVVTGDGKSSISFTDDTKGMDPFTLGLTLATVAEAETLINGCLYRPGQFIEADIVLNKANFNFATDTTPGDGTFFDLKSLITHEFGHAFGGTHTTVFDATMFWVVGQGPEKLTPEEDDILMMDRTYRESGSPLAESISGRVLRGEDGTTPIPGAGVFMIDSVGDTIRMTTTNMNGEYSFFDVTSDVYIGIHPLDGSSGVNGLYAGRVNPEVAGVAQTDFVPELYDGPSESNDDMGLMGFQLSAASMPVTNIDIITDPDLVPPTVIAYSPDIGAVDVAATAGVSVQFSEELNASSFTGEFTFIKVEDGLPVPIGPISFLTPSNTLVFTPTFPLEFEKEYQLTLGTGIQDLFGNNLADPFVLNFAVESQPPLTLASVSPSEAPEGGSIVIAGTGFSTIAIENQVVFNGAVTSPVASTLNLLFVTVPAGAMSGDLTVNVNAASTTDTLNITIVPPKAPPTGTFLSDFALGGNPNEVSVLPDGSWAYVSHDAGITAVGAAPTEPFFGMTTDLTVVGGCAGIVAMPDNRRVLALGKSPFKLIVIDADTSSGTFNTIVNMVDLSHRPRGIAATPDGSRVLIVYEGRVGYHHALDDTDFGMEVKTWTRTGTTFRGEVGVALDFGEGYAATTSDSVAILGFGASEGILAMARAGISPREMGGTPSTSHFLAVDNNGSLLQFGTQGPLQNTLTIGGSYNGFVVSPEGSFAYGANFTFNRIDVFQNLTTTPSKVSAFNTGIDPVDLTHGSSGRYIYVVTDGSNRLEVYDTEDGPVISNVSPASGGTGTLLTITGANFSPTAASNMVSFNGVMVAASDVNAAGTQLLVEQPNAGAEGPLSVSVGTQISNTSPYKVINRPDSGILRVATRIQMATTEDDANLVEAPDGRYLVGSYGDGSIRVIQSDPTQPGFMTEIQTLTPAQTGLSAMAPILFTPDCLIFYVGKPGGEVDAYAVNGASPALVHPPDPVVDGVGGTATLNAQTLLSAPDGLRMFAVSQTDQAVYIVNTTTNTVEDTISVSIGTAAAAAVHPNGKLLYVGDIVSLVPQVRVLDIDPSSATYLTELTSIAVGGNQGPHQFVTTQDGKRLYATVGDQLGLGLDFRIQEVDIDPASGTYHTWLDDVFGAQNVTPVLLPNHSNSILYLGDRDGSQVKAYSMNPLAFQSSTGFNVQFAVLRSLAISKDDGRLYSNAFTGMLQVTDVANNSNVNFFSGVPQTGVAGQALPRPIVAQVVGDGDGAVVEGAFLQYNTNPTGGSFDSGQVEFTAADANGFADVGYVAGAAAGEDTVEVQSAIDLDVTFITVVGDTSLAPPEIIGTAPVNGAVVGVNTSLAVDFSKAINTGTADATTLVLTDVTTGVPVVSTISFANGNTRAVVNPDAPLFPGTGYQFEIVGGPTGIMDNSANELVAGAMISFSTTPPSPPVLSSITPSSASAGNVIVLAGTDFSSDPSQNEILFEGRTVNPSSADPGALTVTVPVQAETGDLRVVVNGTDTTNALGFTLIAIATTPVNEVVDIAAVPESGEQIDILSNGARAYMTSSGSGTAIPVDLSTAVAGSAIPTGLNPFAVISSPSSHRVYVSNYNSHTISVIDAVETSASFHTVIDNIPTQLNPTGMAIHPDGRTLWVLGDGTGTLEWIDTDSTSATFNLAKKTGDTGTKARTITTSPDGGLLYIGTTTGIDVLFSDDGAAKNTYDTGKSAKSIKVTPDGGHAVILTEDDHILLYDVGETTPDDQRAKATGDTGTKARGIEVSPDGGSIYVTTEDNTVLVFSIVSGGGSAAVADMQVGQFSLVLVQTIDVGENPTGIAVDPNTGLIVVVNSGDNTVTLINVSGFHKIVPAELSIDPAVLMLDAQGKFVAATLEFPIYLDPVDIDVSSVLMDSALAPDTTKFALTDKDGDGIEEAEIKFLRTEVQDHLPQGQSIPIHITGLIDGREFAADDTIRVFRPEIKRPRPNEAIETNTAYEIRWIPVPTGPSDQMDIFFTADGGATWDTVGIGIPDDSTEVWTTPDEPSLDCEIMLVAKEANGTVVGIAYSGTFGVGVTTTGAKDLLPARFALHPVAPNPFRAQTQIRFDLPEPSKVSMRIFALDGSLVRNLADDALYPAGRHAVGWDGKNGREQKVSAGVYFLRVKTPQNTAVQKLVMVSR